ncbi:MAG TPA: arylesterase [Gallionella sp.]
MKVVLLIAALFLPHPACAGKNILVFGDSLSAGYGIPVAESWPSLLQLELERSHPGYRVVNASISGETTLGGRQRIAKALQDHRPAIVIVELGANDGLRGYRSEETEANLGAIIRQVKRSRAQVLLVGMRLPPNYGASYTAGFQKLFRNLAKTHRVRLLPFLLEGVPAEQFQTDNLHPVAAAQPHIMLTVLKELSLLLK